jgi:MscS family membrane protein
LLNLGDVAEPDQKTKGAVLARNLCQILQETGAMSTSGVDDSEVGPITEDKPANFAVVAGFDTSLGKKEIWLRRVRQESTDSFVWLVTRRTVSEIEAMHQIVVKKRSLSRSAVKVINVGLGPIPSELALETPRDAGTTFGLLTKEGRYKEAAGLLDLSALPVEEQKAAGPRLARRLSLILKRLRPAGYAGMSNDPLGSPETDVPFDEERLATAKLGEDKLAVRMGLFPRVEKSTVWLFTGETVSNIDPIYDSLGYGWAGDHLPQVFLEVQIMGVQLWQWLGILVAALLSILIGFLVSLVLRKVLLWLAKLTKWAWDDLVVEAMRAPLVGVGWALAFVILVGPLALSDEPSSMVGGIAKLIAILAVGWFFLRLVDVVSKQLFTVFKERGDDMGVAMIPVAQKIFKPIFFVIVVIVALQNVGVDVSGLLAGLGIGGLAFALAAKDTVANIFGSVAIALDRPFKVGEYVKVGSLVGTIEDVGLRSTRIRTADRTIISIPNSQVANEKIENYAARDRIRFTTTFGLQYDTSTAQIEYILDEFKRYLLASHTVWQDSFRARFLQFGSSSKDIEILLYFETTDFNEFTAWRERLLLDLGAIVDGAGAQMAFPTQTVYTGEDSHVDAELAERASALVAERRDRGDLCIPEIPDSIREAAHADRPAPAAEGSEA